jgi:hypothetical protein
MAAGSTLVTLTTTDAVNLLETAETPEAAVEILRKLDQGPTGGYSWYYDPTPGSDQLSRLLELIDQQRLNDMWLAGPEARLTMRRIELNWGPLWMTRLYDTSIREALGDDDFVREAVVWHIVYAHRRALYDVVLADSVRWQMFATCHPNFAQADPVLARLLAKQSYDRVRSGGEDAEQELRFLLSHGGVADDQGNLPAEVPFAHLSHDEQSWVAGHYSAQVLRSVGWRFGINAYGRDKVLALMVEAGLTKLSYAITDEVELVDVLRFNRAVSEAHGEVPADVLLIKEGFGWEFKAARYSAAATEGGMSLSRNDGSTEYSVGFAEGAMKWVYRSRSGASVITFAQQGGHWWVTGTVSYNCLAVLADAGIDPCIASNARDLTGSDVLAAARVSV